MERPTRETVDEAIEEFNRLGSKAFYAKYSSGRPAHEHFIYKGYVGYPMKAIWAAAHRPARQTKDLRGRHVQEEVLELGLSLESDLLIRFRQRTKKDREDRQRPIEERVEVFEVEAAAVELQASVLEGQRVSVETERIKRNPGIVAWVKSTREPVCEACGFDFGKVYGTHGAGYIECHHIDPISGRDGIEGVTTDADLALLCANCHRMVHRKNPCLTIGELKEILLRE